MPKIKIVSLPKFKLGGPDDCPEGFMYDQFSTECVPDPNYSPTASTNSGTVSEDGPGEYVEPQKFNTNATLSTGTPKIGPGTGVNPTLDVKAPDCPKGYYKNKDGKCVPEKKLINVANDFTQSTLAAGNLFAKLFENKQAEAWGQQNRRNSTFSGMVQNPNKEFTMGNQTLNGYQFPGSMAPPNEGMYQNAFSGSQAAFGGAFMSDGQAPSKLRIKILDGPDDDIATMEYGGQSGYAFDSGWKRSYTKMNTTSSDYYTNSMSEDKNSDEEPVLEAEGGETLFKPGDQTMFNLNGPRHSSGGIALTKDQVESNNKPDLASFIFSDTSKMKIKDKETLDYFGVSYKKGGVTPAAVSKKYDLNKWQAILNDPNSDLIAKSTAQLMLNKNIPRLAELAAIQERMKGLKPPAFAEQILGGGSQQQQGSPSGQMPTGRYGGAYRFDDGGLATTTTTAAPVTAAAPSTRVADVKLGEFSEDYTTLETLLKSDDNKELIEEIYNRFKKANPNTKVTQDQYIENLLIAQKQNYAITNAYSNNPDFLNDPSWDWGDNEVRDKKGKLVHSKGWKNKRYNEEVTKLGMSSLKGDDIKQFQQAYRDLADASQDPKFFESFGKYFALNPVGKPDQQYKGKPISPVDDYYGNTTRGQMFRLAKKVPSETFPTTTTTTSKEVVEPKYICIPDGKGGGKVVITNSGYGYATAEEASKHCGEPAKRPPYDFLAPDKLNMLAKAAFAPEMILPFNPDLAFSPRSLNLEYYDAPAAAAFATQYAAPAAQLATYGPTQGLASNLSFLSGQAAQNITGQIMPGVISRNVDRTNAFSGEESKRQDTVDAYNNMQKQKRYEGYATAKKNDTNAWRQYLNENSDAFTRAWDNRQNWGDINDTNSQFYKDFNTGRQVYYNPDMQGRANAGGGGDDASNLGGRFDAYFQSYYDQIKNPKITEAERIKQATKLANDRIESSRTSTTSDPYSNKYKVKTEGYK